MHNTGMIRIKTNDNPNLQSPSRKDVCTRGKGKNHANPNPTKSKLGRIKRQTLLPACRFVESDLHQPYEDIHWYVKEQSSKKDKEHNQGFTK